MITLNDILEMKKNGEDVNLKLCSIESDGGTFTCEYKDNLGIADDSEVEDIFNMLGIDYSNNIKYSLKEYPLVEYGKILKEHVFLIEKDNVYMIDFNIERDTCCKNTNRGFWNFNSLIKISEEFKILHNYNIYYPVSNEGYELVSESFLDIDIDYFQKLIAFTKTNSFY